MGQHESEVDVETAMLKRDVAELKATVAEMSEKIDGLVMAWTTAGNVVAFVKWLSGVAAAVGVLMAAYNGWFGK